MGAGNPAPLAALDVTNARELGARSAYAGAAADQDRQLLDDVKVAIEQLGMQQASLEKARAAATKQTRRSSTRRAARSTQATEEQQALLAQVNGNIKTLVDEIQAEKDREAEAAGARVDGTRAAAQPTPQARAARAQADSSTTSDDGSSGSSSGVVEHRPTRLRPEPPGAERAGAGRGRHREGAARQALRVRRLRTRHLRLLRASRSTRGPRPACRSRTTPKRSTTRSPTSR